MSASYRNADAESYHQIPMCTPTKPASSHNPDVDLIARGMGWDQTEALMKEACAEAGVEWGEEKKPQSIAINVMQRLANKAHKVGFTLGMERILESQVPQEPVKEPVCHICKGTGEMDSSGTQPWGEAINIPCECTAPPAAQPAPTECKHESMYIDDFAAARSFCKHCNKEWTTDMEKST